MDSLAKAMKEFADHVEARGIAVLVATAEDLQEESRRLQIRKGYITRTASGDGETVW